MNTANSYVKSGATIGRREFRTLRFGGWEKHPDICIPRPRWGAIIASIVTGILAVCCFAAAAMTLLVPLTWAYAVIALVAALLGLALVRFTRRWRTSCPAHPEGDDLVVVRLDTWLASGSVDGYLSGISADPEFFGQQRHLLIADDQGRASLWFIHRPKTGTTAVLAAVPNGRKQFFISVPVNVAAATWTQVAALDAHLHKHRRIPL